MKNRAIGRRSHSDAVVGILLAALIVLLAGMPSAVTGASAALITTDGSGIAGTMGRVDTGVAPYNVRFYDPAIDRFIRPGTEDALSYAWSNNGGNWDKAPAVCMAWGDVGEIILMGVGAKASMGGRCTGGGCFVEDTSVQTATGIEPIQDIEVGEQVWSCDTEAGNWQLETVSATFEHSYSGDVVTIDVAGSEIVATGNHPFWVAAGDDLADRPWPEDIYIYEKAMTETGRWVEARDLRVGDELLLTGGQASITGLATEDLETTVYNVNVDVLHNYAVSEAGVLVHNKALRNSAFVDDVAVERHHLVPWNSKYNFQNHELVKQAGNPKLKTDPGNIMELANHRGRHYNSYSKAVKQRLDIAYLSVRGQGQEAAREALDNVYLSLRNDIAAGNLRLNSRDVWVP